eukprot:g3896.t1
MAFNFSLWTVLFLCSILVVSISARSLQQGTGPPLPPDFQFPDFTCRFQGQYPYVVSVRTVNGEHICGGIVIAKDAVLTAAHCVDPRISNEATVRPNLNIGGIDRNEPIQKRKTVRAFPHPGWKGTVLDGDDLVILKLNKKTCITPVLLLGAEDAEDQEGVMFLGYGRTSQGGKFPNLLHGSEMRTLNRTRCNRRYRMRPRVDRNELCARGNTVVGVCVGDDGSPLVIQPSFRIYSDIVIGIASYSSNDCTESEGVSVFMNIYRYRKWINETLQSDEFKEA